MNSVQISGHVKNNPMCKLKTDGKWRSSFVIGSRIVGFRRESTFCCVGYYKVADYIREKIHKDDFVLCFGFLNSYQSSTGKYVVEIIISRFEHVINNNFIIEKHNDALLDCGVVGIDAQEFGETLPEF